MTLHEATGFYGLHGRVSITRKILHCLEKKLRATRDIEKVVDYPFQERPSIKHSPFKLACVRSQANLMEFYLSLYILVCLTKGQELEPSYRSNEYKTTFHGWLQEVCDPKTLHRYKLIDKKRNRPISLDDMVRNVHSFLQYRHHETAQHLLVSTILSRLGRIHPSYSRLYYFKQPAKLKATKKTKTKKSLCRLNCQSDFDTNISDIYDEDHYHDIYDDFFDGKDAECGEVDDISEVVGDSNETTSKESDSEEDSTHSWKEFFELDSLSDGEFTDDVVSFNESFANGSYAGVAKDSDSNANTVGEDWDAISDMQTVISVNTFSENTKGMMFSYKDALNVNRKLAPVTITEEKEAKYTIVSDSKKTQETDLDTKDENNLYSVYFDHDSAKLKGTERRRLRVLKGK